MCAGVQGNVEFLADEFALACSPSIPREGPRLGLILGGELAVLQAPMLDGLSLDPFSPWDDGLGPAEVGIGGRHVVQALVVARVIVVLAEGLDLDLEIASQK